MKRRFNISRDNYPGRETLSDLSAAKNYNSYLSDLIRKESKKSRVGLDFGAGTGAMANMVRGDFETLFTIEPDTHLAAKIRDSGLPCESKIEIFKPESINFVYSLNVFEHIEDDLAVVREIRKILVRKGRILVYVPAFEHLYSKFDESIGHYRRYSRDELERLFSHGGFQIEKIEFHDPIGYFAALAFKLLVNSTSPSEDSIKFFDRFLFPLSRVIQPLTKKLFGKNLLIVASVHGGDGGI